ncbi:MAG: GerMN domain-containing protein [Chloroflexi bacterium]|nr:GerMN domain-containing protein [Chloroflexota bacterium]
MNPGRMDGRRPSLLMSLASTALAFAVIVAGCSASGGDAGPVASSGAPAAPAVSPPPSPSASAPQGSPVQPSSPPPSAAATTSLAVYFLLGEHLVPVQRTAPKTVAVARAAVQQLLAGPTAVESNGASRLVSSIPSGSQLLDIAVSGGIATVDLSGRFESGGGSASMFSRLAQVVYTVTQFPTVTGVRFRLDGQPVTTFSSEGIVLSGPSTRADYRDWLAPITMDTPAWGSTVSNPVRLTGVANVFEAQFQVEIATAAGRVIASRIVTASCGTGCWGTFSTTVPFSVTSAQRGWITVFDLSARDGSRENVLSYPVVLVP